MKGKMYQSIQSRVSQIGISVVGLTVVALCASVLTAKVESVQAKENDKLVEPILLEETKIKLIQDETPKVEIEEKEAVENEENQPNTESWEPEVVESTTMEVSEPIAPQPVVENEVTPIIEEEKEPEVIVEEEPGVSDRSAVRLLGLQMNATQIGALIHRPSSSQLSVLNQLNVAEYHEDLVEEHLLIVPKEVGSTVKLYRLKFEAGDLVEDGVAFEKYIASENDVVSLKCYIPDGIPHLKIVVESPSGRVERILTADGVGNRPAIEYLSAY